MPRRCPPDTLCERDFVLIAPADTEKVAVWKRHRNEVVPARSFIFDFDLAGRWIGLRNTVAAGGQTNPYVLGVGYSQDDQVDVFAWSRSGELALETSPSELILRAVMKIDWLFWPEMWSICSIRRHRTRVLSYFSN